MRLAVVLLAGNGLFGVPRVHAAPLDREETVELFSKAKEFFREGNDRVASDPDAARELYRKAVLRFERIVREGHVHNGRLFYNIGNIYFRMEDLGRAILNYRRAQQYIPNDPNLQQNLDYARAKCLDRIEIEQKTRVLQTLFFWHYDFSTHVRAMVFWIAFVCTWVGLGIRLFLRRPVVNGLIALSGLVAVLFFGSLLAEAISIHRSKPGVVLEREVVARKGDSETYERSFTEPLHAGTEFELLENRGDWYQIELSDGRTCWIPALAAGLVR